MYQRYVADHTTRREDATLGEKTWLWKASAYIRWNACIIIRIADMRPLYVLLLASSAVPWESVAFVRETTALSLSESYAPCDTTMSLSMDVYPRLDKL
jgi:hypothetical protein